MPKKRTKKKPIIKLKKKECCCGATKTIPCSCMILGLDCSSKAPMCLCFKLRDKQIKIRDKK